jgi:hypothetical protein
MGRLIVTTLPNRNCIAAFVASAEGKPALGLGLANFKVRTTLPGADGAHLTISSVVATSLRGFYLLDVSPACCAPARKGVYVFDLIVESGEDRGQTLTSVIMT